MLYCEYIQMTKHSVLYALGDLIKTTSTYYVLEEHSYHGYARKLHAIPLNTTWKLNIL